MVPNEPGFEETEVLGSNPSVDDSLEPNPSEATSTAAETQATDVSEPAAAADTSIPEPSAEADTPVSEPASTPAAPATPSTPTMKRGDLVEGTITATSPTLVTVDLGGEQEGVIPGHELERMNRRMLESLKTGETIKAYVVNPRDHNGHIVLSVNRALEEIDWQRAEEYRQSQEVYESRIAGYNKGGLIVRFGRLRGFVPQSQMSMERRRVLTDAPAEDAWSGMVNEPVVVKVMEVDRARNRLILSERFASRQTREKRKETLIKDLTVGEVREGRVVSLEDFGAFIDIGGAEGLVHLTELSWQHITHPREVLEVGQNVRVEVISIDQEHKRIGLSMKRQEADPWDTIAINYENGQLVQGTVTKLTKFGAFAQLVDVPEIEGLIHISELSDKRVTHPREVVNEGDKLTLRVVKIDIKNRRLGLSLKKVNSAEYLDLDWSTSTGDETDYRDEAVNGAENESETAASAAAAETVEDNAPVEDTAAEADSVAEDETSATTVSDDVVDSAEDSDAAPGSDEQA
ncbi:MAG: S1 RNA-binding domain-containing protein [Chloroflexi bacterium]|nr:S1 RNA-binding domain-containing protein [Chloroflexota bacterium]